MHNVMVSGALTDVLSNLYSHYSSFRNPLKRIENITIASMSAAQKKRGTATAGDVPGAGDPDRKRVLNVLAQRRYRMA